MSVPPNSSRNSQNPRKRSRSLATQPADTYSSYPPPDLSLAGPEASPHPSSSISTPYRQPSIGAAYHPEADLTQHLDSTATYLAQDDYHHIDPQSKLDPAGVTGSVHGSSQVYPDIDYFPRDDHAHNMMMSQRDLGYGYMPAPMGNPLHSYSSGPSSFSPLAPLPGYYSEPTQHQRSYSGSSRPDSLPVFNFQSLGGAGSGEENENSLQSRKRRRTSQHDARRVRMRARRNQLPSILDLGGKGTDLTSGPVDIYPAASAPSTYVQDRLPISSPFQHDYNNTPPPPPPGHASFVSSNHHQPSYSMGGGHMNHPTTLAPPTQGYMTGRSSPLQGPLPPAPAISQHIEPVVVGGGREKPQCWDHGCNGREFSTFSNLLRHQREKSGTATKSYCPHCGAEFTRTTARNGHMEHGKCKTRKTSDTSQPR